MVEMGINGLIIEGANVYWRWRVVLVSSQATAYLTFGDIATDDRNRAKIRNSITETYTEQNTNDGTLIISIADMIEYETYFLEDENDTEVGLYAPLGYVRHGGWKFSTPLTLVKIQQI